MRRIAALTSYLLYFVGLARTIAWLSEINLDIAWYWSLLLSVLLTALIISSMFFMGIVFFKAQAQANTEEDKEKEDVETPERKPFSPININ